MDIRWIDEKHRGMAFHRDGRLLWLSVPAYDTIPWLANGFSTRFGGVSTGDAASLNFDFKRDTNPENVRENTRRFASAVGVTPESVVCTDQTHTARVIRVTAEDRGKGVLHRLLRLLRVFRGQKERRVQLFLHSVTSNRRTASARSTVPS